MWASSAALCISEGMASGVLAIAFVRFHRKQVDDALKILFFSPGELDFDEAGGRSFLNAGECFIKIGILAIHFIDDHKTG
jgi:hypothetical protein